MKKMVQLLIILVLAGVTALAAADVKRGETFEVTFSVTSNTEALTGTVDIDFDQDAFEIVSMEDSGEWEHGTRYLYGGSIGTQSNPEYVPVGAIGTVVFRVKDNAAAGTYSINSNVFGAGVKGRVAMDVNSEEVKVVLDDVNIDETVFPDENFRQYIIDSGIDANGDGKLSENEISSVIDIFCSELGIESLQGIEYFVNVKQLDCSGNQLTELDLSKNTALTMLWCYENQLTALDVSKCPTLYGYMETYEREQWADDYVYDLFGEDFRFDAGVTVTGNYVSKPANESGVVIDETNFPDDNFREYVLKYDTDSDGSLSGDEIAEVTEIDCYNEDINSLKGIEHFTALERLECNNNQLSALDVSNNTALEYLDCSFNQLDALDVSKNTALTVLFCQSNQLTVLDVGKNTALTELVCQSNQLTVLDVSKNTILTKLRCKYNQLSELDLSMNKELKYLSCRGNRITKLDISGNPILKKLVKETTPGDLEPYGYGWWYEDEEDNFQIVLFMDESVKVVTGESEEVPVKSVKLNKTKASMSITLKKPNPTLQLKATVAPEDATNKTVTWKSSNKKVATVSKTGKVTAKGYGTCKITAAAKDGSKKKATCTITVTVDEMQDGDLKYSLNHKKKTATVLGARKSSLSKVTLPTTINANGIEYKVAEVAAKAFKGMKKLVTFKTGKNLIVINASAFENCTALKTIGVQSAKIIKIGKNAFKNIYKKPTLLLNKELIKNQYVNKLTKLLTSGGMKKIKLKIQ